jgi:nucleotide-binding universal stress UspA family protein
MYERVLVAVDHSAATDRTVIHLADRPVLVVR